MSTTAGLMLQLYRRCLLIPGPMSILILEPSLKRTAPLWDITFLWASLIAQLVENLPAVLEMQFIPGTGRSSGGGHSSPLQYSCLENPKDRGAWQATVYGVARVGHKLATKLPPPPFL